MSDTIMLSRPDLTSQDNAGPKRSLILAGGGMRVAYQAGVLKALSEAPLPFAHVDGTSGGTINLAMLLSGLSASEICERWRTLKVRDFVSFMPFAEYLKGPKMMALGDADGLREKVFPHLGIDVAKIRSAEGIQGTFNVCNYSRKTNEVIPHTEIDLDALVAGVSLPIFMPTVRRGETHYTDSVWIKDANLMEAVRRGAEELWVVWCIGNTDEYRRGLFNQYVHMLELSANGALFEEFEHIRALNERISRGDSPYGQTQPIRLHVIKPTYPLPLDPALYLGRITTDDLVNRGYADAKAYLSTSNPRGLSFEPEVTQMESANPGITFRETMAGPFALDIEDPEEGARQATTQLAMHAAIHIRDLQQFIDDPHHQAPLTGHIDFPPLGKQLPVAAGRFNLFAPSGEPDLKFMRYEMTVEHEGQAYYLAGRKDVKVHSVVHLWEETTTLYTRLHKGSDTSGPVVGAGILTLGLVDLLKLVSTIRSTGAETLRERTGAVVAFGAFFARELWDSYGTRKSS